MRHFLLTSLTMLLASTALFAAACRPATPTPAPTPTPSPTAPNTATPLPTRMPTPTFGEPTLPPYPTATATPTSTPYPTYVDISISPESQSVKAGERFEVSLMADTNDKPVAAIATFLNFDAASLGVVEVRPGTTMPLVLTNRYDNETGHIDYAAGTTLGAEPAAGRFVFATVEFQALQTASSTALSFASEMPRETDAAYVGYSVLRNATGATVEIR